MNTVLTTGPAATPARKCVAPAELARQLGRGGDILVLDVRTPAEFRSGHIPGAILMPLGDLNAPEFLAQRKPGAAAIYLVCQTGNRARKAMDAFERAGYFGGVVLEGGMDAWAGSGLAINRALSGGLPIMRQVQIAVGAVNLVGAILALLVDPLFALIPLVTALGLLFAGLSGWCGLAFLLAKMPWNRLSATCSTTGSVAHGRNQI